MAFPCLVCKSICLTVSTCMQAWNTYNTPKLDFQQFFCCNNSRAMTALQTPEEAKQMPLTWDIKSDSNTSYFATHLRYMTSYFFGSKKTA